MNSNNDNTVIVRTIINLADSLALDVIAEGIETDSQLSQLQGFGCAYGQGYLFAHPISPTEMPDYLLKQG